MTAITVGNCGEHGAGCLILDPAAFPTAAGLFDVLARKDCRTSIGLSTPLDARGGANLCITVDATAGPAAAELDLLLHPQRDEEIIERLIEAARLCLGLADETEPKHRATFPLDPDPIRALAATLHTHTPRTVPLLSWTNQ